MKKKMYSIAFKHTEDKRSDSQHVESSRLLYYLRKLKDTVPNVIEA